MKINNDIALYVTKGEVKRLFTFINSVPELENKTPFYTLITKLSFNSVNGYYVVKGFVDDVIKFDMLVMDFKDKAMIKTKTTDLATGVANQSEVALYTLYGELKREVDRFDEIGRRIEKGAPVRVLRLVKKN